MASDGEIVLSFQNSLLRESDLLLLEGKKWLNDQLIAFAFEYFEYNQFHGYTDDVAFIGPDVVQLIKFSQDAEIGMLVESLDLGSKRLVFLAVNDSNSVSSVGGTHWTLLLYSRTDATFKHYDSSGSYNEETASQIAKKMQSHVGAPQNKIAFVTEQSPQQQNGYDCGLFVICNTEHLCKQHLHGDRTTLEEAVTQARVTSKRTELKDLILSLGVK